MTSAIQLPDRRVLLIRFMYGNLWDTGAGTISIRSDLTSQLPGLSLGSCTILTCINTVEYVHHP